MNIHGLRHAKSDKQQKFRKCFIFIVVVWIEYVISLMMIWKKKFIKFLFLKGIYVHAYIVYRL